MALSLGNSALDHISVVDEKHGVISDSERLAKLFAQGFHFEACAAQALLIEALCVMYLLLRKQAHGVRLLERSGKPADIGGKATFGRIVNLLFSSRALHIPDLEADLKDYVQLRNDLVHEVVGTSLDFDFKRFFTTGERIITALKPHFVETFARINNREVSKANA